MYIVEQWIDGQRIDYGSKHAACPYCKIYTTAYRTFAQKWAHDLSRGWHMTDYTIRQEVPQNQKT